jgi:hypothetical protein
MAEKSNVYEQAVKHKGFFNYSDLYNFCYNWFKEEGYKLSEDTYTEKLSGFGKEIQIEWKASKKISDYYKNVIEAKWHILGMNDAEVEIDGKKVKTNKGEVKIKISADLVRDYEENWDKKPMWKFLRGIYDKYIMRTTQDEYEDRLAKKTISFVEDLKSFLNLEGRR